MTERDNLEFLVTHICNKLGVNPNRNRMYIMQPISAYARTAQVRALRDAADDYDAGATDDVSTWLRAKADEIEREAK